MKYHGLNIFRQGICLGISMGAIFLTPTPGRAAEVDVQITSSPQTITILNEGETVTPTIYILGQSAGSGTPRNTSGVTLNAVRLSNRILNQGVLILRPDGTGTFGYQAGFDLFPEPIAQWPEYDQHFNKWKFDPVRVGPVIKTAGNFLQVSSQGRPVSTIYELTFPGEVRVESITVAGKCDQRDPKLRVITRVWAEAERKHLLGEAQEEAPRTKSTYSHDIGGLDKSSVFVELTSNGEAKSALIYHVTLSAELNTKALKLPHLAPGNNEITYSDDENSPHKARVIFRWGKEKRAPRDPIPDWLLNYSSPIASKDSAAQSIVKLRQFFPLGVYGGIYDYPQPVIDWMLDDLRSHNCNAWHVNNLEMGRLSELIPAAEKRGIRVLPQGGGWESLYYSSRRSMQEQEKSYQQSLVPSAKAKVPQWQGRWGLLGWSLTEEILPDAAARLSPYYKLMRELDSTHESLILHNSAEACKRDAALNRVPVAYCDIYPFFLDCRSGPCTARRSLQYYRRTLASYAAIARERRIPLWVMMQAYGERPELILDAPYFGYDGGRPVPSPAQLSVQLWLALAYGAKGLWWYPYTSNRAEEVAPVTHWKSTAMWDCIATLFGTVAKLSDILLRLEPDPDPPSATIVAQNIFSAWHRVASDPSLGRYIIAVNENLQGSETIAIKPHRGSERVFEITSGRAVEVQSRLMKPGEGAVFVLRP